jgi:RHS repeat-associated protein
MHTTSATYGTEQERVIFGEKSDHLGNVRAVVSDVRKPVNTTGDISQWTWQADVTQSFAYYPYGQQMPGQSSDNSTVENGSYKFGFNGKLRDDFWHDIPGSHYDFGARIYDSRIGRFLSRDPLQKLYPHLSPYAFAANSPVVFIDIDGEGPGFVQFNFGVNGELKAQVFTTNYTYLSRVLASKMLVAMSIEIPKQNENTQNQIDKFDNLAKTIHPFVESNVISASGPVGVVAAGIDVYANMKKLKYQYKQAEETTKINDVIDTRQNINLSITTGKWLLNSLNIAKEHGVFDDMENADLVSNTSVDIVNYGIMYLAGRDELLKKQKYFAKPEDMTREEYKEFIETAFEKFAADIIKDIEDSQGQLIIHKTEDRYVNTIYVPGKDPKYSSQPKKPDKDYLPKN